jgi:hypothetical protein
MSKKMLTAYEVSESYFEIKISDNSQNRIFAITQNSKDSDLLINTMNSNTQLISACVFALRNTDESKNPIQYKKLKNALRAAKALK